MTSEEITQQREDIAENYFISEIFGKQKVKLYEIKHFLFDFGGVMIEKTFVLKNLLNMIEDDLKIKIPREEGSKFRKYRRQVSSGILSGREFLERLFEKYYYPFQKQDGALPPKKVNTDYYLELWFHHYSQMTHLSEEMEKIVTRLHNAGYIVSLFSNTFDVHAKSNELNGFFAIFDHIFLSNETGFIKPDLEKYKHVLQVLNTKPKKCIFIDDKLRNLIPAAKLGMTVIKFESIETFQKQLKALGIGKIKKNLRNEIKRKYKQYQDSKEEYKIIKREYKKAKKDFLKKKKNSLKKKQLYKTKRTAYEQKKIEFKKEKEVKKQELEFKI